MWNYKKLKKDALGAEIFWRKVADSYTRYDDEKMQAIGLVEKYKQLRNKLSEREVERVTEVIEGIKIKNGFKFPENLKEKLSEEILSCINHIEKNYQKIIDLGIEIALQKCNYSILRGAILPYTVELEEPFSNYYILHEITYCEDKKNDSLKACEHKIFIY